MTRRLLGLLVAVCACGPPSEPPPGSDRATEERIAYRLVDAPWRLGARRQPPTLETLHPDGFRRAGDATSQTPTATLGASTRTVLASHEREVLLYVEDVAVAAAGRVAVDVPLGDRLAGAAELLLQATVRLGEAPWSSPPPRVAPVTDAGGQRRVRLELALPGAEPGDAAQVSLMAYRPLPGGEMIQELPALEVPEASRLEFGFGLLAAAGAPWPVVFSVEACQGERCEPLFRREVGAAEAEAGWLEARVPLDAQAGRSRRLRFRAAFDAAGGSALPVWAHPTLVARVEEPAPAPSLILLSLDTLGRDHLDLYGYGRETAPFLRREFAPGGVVLDNLIAEAATTDPSHMTLFTSLPSPVHGVAGSLNTLAVPVRTLAGVLREHGYETAAFNENGPLAHARGFSIGFDQYHENKSANLLRPSGQIQRTFAQARAWMDRHGERPFFLFLHTFQVHAPYEPPPDYAGYFADEPGGTESETPTRGSRLATLYDREIRFVDDELAALAAWVEERGLAERTVWVVLSDHGESFYEHGAQGHATLPYEEVLRVPLIVRGPGVGAGLRRADPLHHLDLMPTLLELLGVAAPTGLRGRSRAALLRNEPAADPGEERPLFSVSWALPPELTPPALTVRLGDRKLIRYQVGAERRYEYYDLAADPGERTDLYAARDEEAADLVALLERYEQENAVERAARTVGGGPTPAPPLIDPEREEKLRALGYIE